MFTYKYVLLIILLLISNAVFADTSIAENDNGNTNPEQSAKLDKNKNTDFYGIRLSLSGKKIYRSQNGLGVGIISCGYPYSGFEGYGLECTNPYMLKTDIYYRSGIMALTHKVDKASFALFSRDYPESGFHDENGVQDTSLNGIYVSGMQIHTQYLNGMGIAGFVNLAAYVKGFQFSLASNAANQCSGIQLSVGQSTSRYMEGVQIGGVTCAAHRLRGISVGGIVNSVDEGKGVQIGAVNLAKHLKEYEGYDVTDKSTESSASGIIGMQLGGINIAHSVTGLQIGVINSTRTLKGLQIGVLNLDSEIPWGFLPVLNVRF